MHSPSLKSLFLLQSKNYYPPLSHISSTGTNVQRHIEENSTISNNNGNISFLETSFECSKPPPTLIPIYNSTSNTTTYFSVPQEVNQVKISFGYEIYHERNVEYSDWEEGEKRSLRVSLPVLRNIQSVSNELENDGKTRKMSSSTSDGGGNLLREQELVMVSELWDTIWKDANMTWNETTGDCAGLAMGVEDWESDDELETSSNLIEMPTLQTKLLGLSVYPPDEVNMDGCITPSNICTAIQGRIFATYIGTNEYAITNNLKKMLQSGMQSGQFLVEGGPAYRIDFQASEENDDYASEGGESSGMVVPIQTDRGTHDVQKMEEQNNYISKYGKLFVALFVVLATGIFVSIVFRRRRKKTATQKNAGERTLAENTSEQPQQESPTEHMEEPQKNYAEKSEVDTNEEKKISDTKVERGTLSRWNFFGNKNVNTGEESGNVIKEKESEKDPSSKDVMDNVELSAPSSDNIVEISLSSPKRG